MRVPQLCDNFTCKTISNFKQVWLLTFISDVPPNTPSVTTHMLAMYRQDSVSDWQVEGFN